MVTTPGFVSVQSYNKLFHLEILYFSIIYYLSLALVGWADMYYDCTNDYTVCRPAVVTITNDFNLNLICSLHPCQKEIIFW